MTTTDDLALAGAGRALLIDVLRSAVVVPGDDPAARRLAAAAVVALATHGDEAIVAATLGGGAPYELRVQGTDELAAPPSIAGLSPLDAVRCFAGALQRSPDATLELLASEAGGDRRPVLVRPAGEPAELLVDDAARRRLVPLLSAADEHEPPVAALAEVLAHLPTPDDIAEAVAGALAGATVEIDVDALSDASRVSPTPAPPSDEWLSAVAEAVLVRLVSERRAPRAHDVADLLAGVLPTAAEVAQAVALELGPRVDVVAAGLRDALAGGVGELRRSNEQIATSVRAFAERVDALEATALHLERQLARVREAIIG